MMWWTEENFNKIHLYLRRENSLLYSQNQKTIKSELKEIKKIFCNSKSCNRKLKKKKMWKMSLRKYLQNEKKKRKSWREWEKNKPFPPLRYPTYKLDSYCFGSLILRVNSFFIPIKWRARLVLPSPLNFGIGESSCQSTSLHWALCLHCLWQFSKLYQIKYWFKNATLMYFM